MHAPPMPHTLRILTAALLLAGCAVSPTRIAPPSAQYQPVSFSDLPGWQNDDIQKGFNTWKSGCPRLKNDNIWGAVCLDAMNIPDNSQAIRAFLESNLIPLQLNNADGSQTGLITGYYEPVYDGSLTQTETARYPLYERPENLITVALDELYPELKGKRLRGKLSGQKLVPYASSSEITQRGIDAPVLAWLQNPMDVQFMQIQGSGRVRLANGREIRIGYSDQNGHPYQPIGRWLVQQGELPADAVSMQSIRTWAQTHPERITELLASNPSYVFFRQLPPSSGGPIGSLGIPLTAERSIAVDRQIILLGSLVYLATDRPDNTDKIQKLVAAQDTGGAIKGQVRADYFWGTGNGAGDLAGKMKQKGLLWLLWPKNKPFPQ